MCCLLVLDSVTSTPQWIRQPKLRDPKNGVTTLHSAKNLATGDSTAEELNSRVQSNEQHGPNYPLFARLEADRLKLHELKLKLAVEKQMYVDQDIASNNKGVWYS